MSTERVDPRFTDIDQWPTLAAVEAMLEAQRAALTAIEGQTAMIAAAADAAAERLKSGGRLVYAGAGTSGRIAVQDGVELSPTFNWPTDRLVFIMAGGLNALVESVEGAEDDADEARRQVTASQVGPDDVVIGVAASGSTPFTVAIIEAARAKGALTIGLANNIDAPIVSRADFGICVETGSEVVAGSTRMKAGTAQKAVLNILSTAIMMRSGLIFRGMMINVRILNEKLLARGVSMIRALTGVDRSTASQALDEAGLEVRPAVLIALGANPIEADRLLTRHKGDLTEAITAMQRGKQTDG